MSTPESNTQPTFRTPLNCHNGQCVAVAIPPIGDIAIKRIGSGPSATINFTRAEWAAFILGVKNSEFDI